MKYVDSQHTYFYLKNDSTGHYVTLYGAIPPSYWNGVTSEWIDEAPLSPTMLLRKSSGVSWVALKERGSAASLHNPTQTIVNEIMERTHIMMSSAFTASNDTALDQWNACE